MSRQRTFPLQFPLGFFAAPGAQLFGPVRCTPTCAELAGSLPSADLAVPLWLLEVVGDVTHKLVDAARRVRAVEQVLPGILAALVHFHPGRIMIDFAIISLISWIWSSFELKSFNGAELVRNALCTQRSLQLYFGSLTNRGVLTAGDTVAEQPCRD